MSGIQTQQTREMRVDPQPTCRKDAQHMRVRDEQHGMTALHQRHRLIDGLLHWIARNSLNLGSTLRDKFDTPVINGFGDWTANTTAAFGRVLRKVQTGQVQQYLLLVAFVAFGGLFYYLFTVLR